MDKKGLIHPLNIVIQDIVSIFSEMGFGVATGPETEDTFHNFDALNIPKDHPARDMQDTFYIKGENDLVLRTHTSPVQIRFMENNLPPFGIVVPGKTYRNEATDATHEAQFYQIEGLSVHKKASMAELKYVLENFLKKFFGKDVDMRFRPGYFPFVEPGIEVDLLFNGKWLEVLGAGMVHPNVFKNVNKSRKDEEYSGVLGYAFGIGVDRLLMMKYGVSDIRLSYNGDLRFINQFDVYEN